MHVVEPVSFSSIPLWSLDKQKLKVLRAVTRLCITQGDLLTFQTSDDYVFIHRAEHFELP